MIVSPNLASSPATPASKPSFGVRIADIAALRPDGSTVLGQRRIPTLPQFDQAFGAFAQGTLFKTDKGYMAVEDLQPGDRVETAKGDTDDIVWIGAASFSPNDLGERMSLTRITADSFGVNRPTNCVSLGSAARVLQTPPDMRGMMATTPIMTPARRFVDGVSVIEVAPPTSIRLFHIATRSHQALIAGGLEVESFHPGTQPLQFLSQTLSEVFLSCFPHVENLGEFGPMAYQRATDEDGQSAA